MTAEVPTKAPATVRSTGPITFGPDGVLYLADNASAKIFALEIDEGAPAGDGPVEISRIVSRVAAALGCETAEVRIHDIAAHPRSRRVYLSVSRGHGNAATPAIVRIDRTGMCSRVPLDGAVRGSVDIVDAPADDDELGFDYEFSDGKFSRKRKRAS